MLRGQKECKRTGVVGEVDGVHDIDVEAEELEREGCSLVPAVARDDVRLDAQDSPAGHLWRVDVKKEGRKEEMSFLCLRPRSQKVEHSFFLLFRL